MSDKKIANIEIPEIENKIALNYPSINADDKKYTNFSQDHLNNMPSLFYFLDGFINDDAGDTRENVQNYVTQNRLIPTEQTNTFVYIIYNFTIRDPIWEFTNNTLHIRSYMGSWFESQCFEIFKKQITSKQMLFWIASVGHDKHATSLVLFVKNNAMYFMSFNSGLGINHHKQNQTNNTYLPYFGFKICENIKVDLDFTSGWNFYMRILYFNILYDY